MKRGPEPNAIAQSIQAQKFTPEHKLNEDRIIYRQDLYKGLGVTSETLRRWIRDGKMPAADIAITRRTVGWRLSTLQAAGIRLL